MVEFESPHDNFDFGIRRAAVHGQDPDELFLLSFKPGKNDHIAPLIPPRKFASMRQITLNPKTTCGSLSNWWRGREVPRALKPPELIFTDSGLYQILLGRGLGSEDPRVADCSAYYVNEERQPGAPLEVEALYEVIDSTYYHSCSARTYERAITCPPTAVHRGERLALDLQSDNPASKIGIVDPDWQFFVLPTEKNPGPNPSRSFPGLRIVTGSETARPYSFDSTASYGIPSTHIETSSGRIFTKSGWYIAFPVPSTRCDIENDVGACWIHYINAPR